jgi:CPA2 family monovalent cation:H+ antiporter-2
VTAVDYSKFLTLDQRDFRRFLRKFPEIREKIASKARSRVEMNRTEEPEAKAS